MSKSGMVDTTLSSLRNLKLNQMTTKRKPSKKKLPPAVLPESQKPKTQTLKSGVVKLDGLTTEEQWQVIFRPLVPNGVSVIGKKHHDDAGKVVRAEHKR